MHLHVCIVGDEGHRRENRHREWGTCIEAHRHTIRATCLAPPAHLVPIGNAQDGVTADQTWGLHSMLACC